MEAAADAIRRKVDQIIQDNDCWAACFRKICGVSGVIDKYYPLPEERIEFERSSVYLEVLESLARKRSNKSVVSEEQQSVLLRIPKSMHSLLKRTAHDLRISLNQLIITKLMLPIPDTPIIPAEV